MSKVYLPSKQVRIRYGNKSEMWLTRTLARDPSFPRPKKLGGRMNHWALDELEVWERASAAKGHDHSEDRAKLIKARAAHDGLKPESSRTRRCTERPRP